MSTLKQGQRAHVIMALWGPSISSGLQVTSRLLNLFPVIPFECVHAFEVMSVLKYLSSFMFNHGCLRSGILFFFLGKGDESITTVHIHQRSGKKNLGKVLHITKHDLLKQEVEAVVSVPGG